MAVIDMSKNQKISMMKDDGSAVKNFFIGVNWDKNRYSGEAEIDFGTVVSGIHTYIMGERSWLRSSRSRSYVDSIREIMIANRQLNT